MQEFVEASQSDGDPDRIRVALVDDDQDFVSLASTLLESENESLDITTYTDPRTALDQVEFAAIDCIVSDYRMPEMDGIEFLEAVREEHPKLPFILFTGKGGEDVAGRAISAGVNDYIIKDGSVEQYAISANRIENLVQQYRTWQRWVRKQGFDALSRSVFDTVLNEQSRKAIEQGVCDQLVAADLYSFAWIGERVPQTEEIRPRAFAGESELLDSVTFSAGRDPPRSVEERALERGERTVETDLSDSGEWAANAKDSGFEAAIGYPLVYEDIPYGVLGVYTERADAFVSEELNTLDLITEFVAFSVAASKRREGDISRRIVEIEFDVTDTDLPFVRIASALERPVRLTRTAHRSDGTRLAIYTAEEIPEQQPSELESLLGLDVVRVSERPGSDTEFAVASSDPWWEEFTELYGANIGSAIADETSATLLIELPAESDVRTVVDLIEERYPNAKPIARRERIRSQRSIDDLQPVLDDRLTQRQLEALETAYHAGYYEWPREASSREVAGLLGIAQPTFAEHFWTAQRRIVELLLETESAERDPS